MEKLDPEVRKHLIEIAANYESFTTRVTWLFRLFVVLFVGSAAIFTMQQGDISSATKDNKKLIHKVDLANRTNKQVIQANAAARLDNIRRACVESNNRYDNTVNALDTLLAKAIKEDVSEARKQQIKQSRNGTILLIKGLTPKRDCDKVVAAAKPDKPKEKTP